jgi:rare lipoprotein A
MSPQPHRIGPAFNQEAMTAAHRTFLFGTRVKVTHAGRSVVVTINDRGLFIESRVSISRAQPAQSA